MSNLQNTYTKTTNIDKKMFDVSSKRELLISRILFNFNIVYIILTCRALVINNIPYILLGWNYFSTSILQRRSGNTDWLHFYRDVIAYS